MPRYLIERTFRDGLAVPATPEGAESCDLIGRRNAEHGVNWLHSYVTEDRTRTWCIYDAPSPEAIRRAAADNGLPVDHIASVRVLDPFFHIAPAMVEG